MTREERQYEIAQRIAKRMGHNVYTYKGRFYAYPSDFLENVWSGKEPESFRDAKHYIKRYGVTAFKKSGSWKKMSPF